MPLRSTNLGPIGSGVKSKNGATIGSPKNIVKSRQPTLREHLDINAEGEQTLGNHKNILQAPTNGHNKLVPLNQTPTGRGLKSWMHAAGTAQSPYFTEVEWQKLGLPADPIQHLDKHAEVESKIEYVNQLGASQYPLLGVQRESLSILGRVLSKS